MKRLFTAEAISNGGRSGTIHSPNYLLNITLGNPMESGAENRGPSPELLFAGAYAACFQGALTNAAKKFGAKFKSISARALVSLNEDAEGGYHLAVELQAQLPGVAPDQAQLIMDEAHRTCPYSKLVRHGAPVEAVVKLAD